ncbi:hypothetical protein [Clostridium perfringens]|uniref:hypothetical protein n=1 Tax=Clostridium perfringens TaxID=1502 RepID=UPI0018E4081B|nr:hypothetical protein [Clostridium perfringens]EHK2368121.1 hypothetical protein [Clostridium perfringens]MBI5987324.1 hypothetical protein [Clostridium perfringens]MBI6054695.1 hypothetical protein [Clostridium perfringens]MDM0743549.1 hypothetical protein [Clostridium perfringens]MDM0775464.1 hypothetical protein [Clostridium perfringens]
MGIIDKGKSALAEKVFKKEIQQIKEKCYHQEKQNVENEYRKLESSYMQLQKDYSNLAQQKFVESVNADLQRAQHLEQNLEQTKQHEKEKNNTLENPFDNWT